MFIADYHIHTNHSLDSDENVENMILSGINRKINEIAITDHYEFDHPYGDFSFDVESYYKEIFKLKEKYKDFINIKIGVEIGLHHAAVDRANAFYSQNKDYFDFVISSCHVFNGIDPHDAKIFSIMDKSKCYFDYFSAILYMVKNFHGCNVYGHLDYLMRYDPDEVKYNYSDYNTIIDEILVTIINNNKGIEVNTSGFRYGLNHAIPKLDIIKRYKELGGKIITVGSDSHSVEYVGEHIKFIYKLLKDIGFKYITTFTKMEPQYIRL